ncbi:MAG TPA: D-glycero-beta-D-manno-heptose 1-phosphate adenylyltransferase [Bacteroidia bacterium]|nr:D-glycero-beta-D-manno-heptose 1-phosphate adenylyltransferase [Bacteroidia bacterium]HNU33345.1 D-glycero-beta-D-manno-heptose 1-phosphate adenylyltransferase [Bacteroidia bacterium]
MQQQNNSPLSLLERKIFTRESVKHTLNYWHFMGKKIVFTNGCFDILHKGHVAYLTEAKALGDVLIMGLNSNSSVKKLKGESRPVNDENARAFVLAGLAGIDAVIIFEEDTPYDLIKFIQPHVLVKGGDYKPEQIAGHDLVEASGGKVVIIPFFQGFSTSGVIRKMK